MEVFILLVSWSDITSYEFCFRGIEKNSIVAVSTVGVKRNEESLQLWKNGMDELIRQIEPRVIIVYGGKIDYNYDSKIQVIYYKNEVTERWRKNGKKKI